MKLNVREEIVALKTLYPAFAEKIDFICNENKRFELFEAIKALKNEVVKVQNYEPAAYLRELEHQIFGDIFKEPLQILNHEKLLLVDFNNDTEFKAYCKFVEEDPQAMKQLWSDIDHAIVGTQNGEFVIRSTGKLTIDSRLNIKSISTFLK